MQVVLRCCRLVLDEQLLQDRSRGATKSRAFGKRIGRAAHPGASAVPPAALIVGAATAVLAPCVRQHAPRRAQRAVLASKPAWIVGELTQLAKEGSRALEHVVVAGNDREVEMVELVWEGCVRVGALIPPKEPACACNARDSRG